MPIWIQAESNPPLYQISPNFTILASVLFTNCGPKLPLLILISDLRDYEHRSDDKSPYLSFRLMIFFFAWMKSSRSLVSVTCSDWTFNNISPYLSEIQDREAYELEIFLWFCRDSGFVKMIKFIKVRVFLQKSLKGSTQGIKRIRKKQLKRIHVKKESWIRENKGYVPQKSFLLSFPAYKFFSLSWRAWKNFLNL